MRKAANSQNRFVRLMTLPIRVLAKARDLYVKSIINCSGSATYGATAMGIGSSGQLSSLPKSFSANSSTSTDRLGNDDLRELIRAASARSGAGQLAEMDLYLQHQMRSRSTAAAAAAVAVVPRSCSVGMGRIDEEGPCEFFGEEELLVYPRSRSHAVAKRRVVFS